MPTLKRRTLSHPFRMSSTYRRHSRDMDSLLLYPWPQFWPQGVGRHEIDRPAKKVLQVEFQAHEAIEVGLPFEPHKEVEVTPFTDLVACHRAEDGQVRHTEP